MCHLWVLISGWFSVGPMQTAPQIAAVRQLLALATRHLPSRELKFKKFFRKCLGSNDFIENEFVHTIKALGVPFYLAKGIVLSFYNGTFQGWSSIPIRDLYTNLMHFAALTLSLLATGI